MKGWFSSPEAAKILNVHERTVRRWATEGKLPRDSESGSGAYRYWLDKRKVAELRQRPADPEPGDLERAILIPDPHVPDIDRQSWDIVKQIARWHKPDYCFVMGDLIDSKAVSKYTQSPGTIDYQTELDLAKEWLEETREVVGHNCEIIWLLGNHEARFKTYLYSQAPALASLRAMNLRDLMKIDDDITIVPYDHGYDYKGRHIRHGRLVSKNSGYTAHRLMDRDAVCGANGHTHRLAHVFKRCKAGELDWVECGTLQKKDPSYVKGDTTNWQHGCVLTWHQEGWDAPKANVIHIDDQHVACYAGMVFTSEEDEV